MASAFVVTWQRASAMSWLAAGMACAIAGAPAWLPLAAAGALVLAYGVLFARISTWAPADWVTLLRVVLLAVCAALAGWHGTIDIAVWVLCGVALAADLLDGFVARRTRSSAPGALLDMEADQAATLLLAVLAVVPGGAGAWALLLPAFRFTFVVLGWACALPTHDPKPRAGDNRRARRVCAMTMVLQLVAIAPFAPAAVRDACLVLAAAALTYSYSDDLRFLLRQRAVRGA